MNKNKKISNAIICLATDDNSILSSSSSEDEDMEDLKILEVILRNRNCIQNYFEVISMYNEQELKMHFRLSRHKFEGLASEFLACHIYRNLQKNPNTRLNIDNKKSVLVFLWFAGHQTSYREVGDRFNLSISSVYDVITRVSMFLSDKAKDIIKLPNERDKRETKDFFAQKGFPNVIGCIDGCHIKIDRPRERPIDYFNRKDYPSIILQGICNEKREFIDIFVGYPGSVHDARVFNNSSILEKLETLCNDGSYILGDSAYPLLPQLLTPYKDNGHLTGAQKCFNRSLSSCRVTIEHTFGILKQRFRQLYHLKLKEHERICHFIRACCVLHNIGSQDGEILPLDEIIIDEQLEPDYHQIAVPAAVLLRNRICEEMYARRE